MIGHLQGTILVKKERGIILDVHGVGYAITLPLEALRSLREGTEVALHTHLAVREDALDLYGFIDEETLLFFKLLNTVSGIGPKTALGVLDVSSPSSLRKAITSGDISHLTKVSGIGAKLANKIVLELKGKVGTTSSEQSDFKGEVEALEALLALGYAHKDARDALRQVPLGTKTTNDRIKEALKILGS